MNVSTGFLIFRILLPTLILGLQYFLYRRTRRWIKERKPEARWPLHTATGLFLAFNIPFIIVAITRPRLADFPEWFIYTGVYPFFLWHGSMFFLGLILLATLIIKSPFLIGLWASKKIPATRSKMEKLQSNVAFQEFNASRRVFLRRGVYGLTAVSFSGGLYGLVRGRTMYDVTSAEFAIPNLPPQLANFTIGLVSDIHSSVFMTKESMDEYAAIVNSLNADMIAVTGDFVNSMTEEVYPFVEAFSTLKAPYGVYGVMGNHDFFAQDPELVAREIDGAGIKLLRDDKVIIEKDGGQFYLVGVDDMGRAPKALERIDSALGYAPLGIPRILLCHRPYFLAQAAARKMNLVLSGHTHGGQIVLGHIGESVIAPASVASPYIWGKYELNGTHMYVSRGIGTVGIPVRINCPPEITKITLVPA